MRNHVTKLKCKLHHEIMKLLHFTFVYPHLLYGIAVYANTPSSHISKLQILNNRLLRIAQDCSIPTKINILYTSYNTLPVTVLHSYQILLFVHKCLFNSHLLPSVFHGYFDLNSSVHATRLDYRINYTYAACIHHLVQSVLNSKVVNCGIIYPLVYLCYRHMFHSSVNLSIWFKN